MRRTITLILSFLAIGTIINAAVTWGCWKWSVAWQCDEVSIGLTDFAAPCLYAESWIRPGTTRIQAMTLPEQATYLAVWEDLYGNPDDFDPDDFNESVVVLELLHYLDPTIDHGQPDSFSFHDAQSWGWPYRSVFGAQIRTVDIADVYYDLDDWTERIGSPRLVDAFWMRTPLSPLEDRPPFRGILWRGMFLNVVVFGLASFALFVWAWLLKRTLLSHPVSAGANRAIVALVLSVLTTTAIAWGCAAFIEPLAEPAWDADHRDGGVLFAEGALPSYSRWTVDEHITPGAKVIESRWHDGDVGGGGSGGWPSDPPEAVLPWWWGESLVPPVPAQTSRHAHRRIGEAWGWPFLAMWCEWRHDRLVQRNATGSYACFYGIPLKGTTSKDSFHFDDHDRALPLAIVWPGFLFNVVIYWWTWLTLWIGFASLKNLRAWRRRRNGQCVRCAYDLRAIDADRCPECGESIQPSRAESS